MKKSTGSCSLPVFRDTVVTMDCMASPIRLAERKRSLCTSTGMSLKTNTVRVKPLFLDLFLPDLQNTNTSILHAVDLRLVFTSDGVVVGVVIRSIEWYDLAKVKPTESEAEHWFCLWLRRLSSSENSIVGVASRSERINQWQRLNPGLAIGWFFRFCFRLR